MPSDMTAFNNIVEFYLALYNVVVLKTSVLIELLVHVVTVV